MSNELNKEFDLPEQPVTSLTNNRNNNSDFDTVKLEHVLTKSWKFVVLIFLLCTTLAFIYNRYTKPLYRSSATIQLEFNEDAKIIGLGSNLGGPQAKSLSTEIELLKSNMLYNQVLKKLDLSTSYFYEGKFINDEKFSSSNIPFKIQFDTNQASIFYDRPVFITANKDNSLTVKYSKNLEDYINLTTHFNDTVSIDDFKFTIKKTASTKQLIEAPFYFRINSEKTLLNYLNKNLSIEILNYQANTLGIHFTDFNKLKAKTINQAIIDVYLLKSIEQKQKSNAQTLGYIDRQLDSTQVKLEHTEDQMQALSQGSIFGNTSESYKLLSHQIAKYELEKNELSQKTELLNHLNNLIINNEDLDNFIPNLEGLAGTSLTASITHLNDINQEFQKLQESHKPSTLSYKNKEIERNATRNTILGYIFENKKILLERLQEISNNLQEINDELLKLPSKETDLVRLKRYYGLYEQFFLLLNQKKVEFETAKAGKVPDFLVLSSAEIDKSPITASPSFIYIISLITALLFSFSLILSLFFLQNKILNKNELEKISNIPVIGSIPKYRGEKMQYSKLQVIDFPQSRISESFRNIRSNLEYICPDKPVRMITISSTISGEGKTFITLNLAGILALSGKKVIVLDLDMRKPKLHLGFDTVNGKGISDLLVGKSTIADCIKHSSFKDLDFITAGNKPPNPSELILNKNFDILLYELKTSYDVILIDTPPIGLVTDGIHAMKKADVQLYIARANHTKTSMIKDVEFIRASKRLSNLSFILNDVSKGSSYGHSGYGYGYGYYDDELKSTPNKA